MTSTHRSASSFNIPTIDIAPFLQNPSSLEAFEVIQAVRKACTTTGFFQLVGHGIPRSLQDAMLKGSEALFKLPLKEKLKMDRSHSIGASNRGYEFIGNQVLQEDTLPDLKEGFYIGKEIPATDPRVRRNVFLMGPNIWPNTSHISEEVFRNPMSEYYSRMYALTLQVLNILAAGMPYEPDVFREFCSNDAVAALRLLHYPPDNSNDERQFGAGAHTDFGAITLLLQDRVGGLQVWDGDGEMWADLLPNEDAYVVNVGDMLETWTGGKYRSNLHRVVNRSGSDRYSAPFFFDGNVDCVLKPLDGSDPNGKHLTVEQHMKERFAATYGERKVRDDSEDNLKA